MSAELEVLQDALARLERGGVAYMLTGSLALSYYAEPRMTRDIDVARHPGLGVVAQGERAREHVRDASALEPCERVLQNLKLGAHGAQSFRPSPDLRSEERRVGKECRSRWSR